VVGTWTVASSCLTVSGTLAPSSQGLNCSSAPVTGSLKVTGTLTANSDGTYSDRTTTSGTEQFTLAKSCLVISSTPIDCDQAANVMQNLGFDSVRCNTVADGGCSCSGTVQQIGGIGLVSTDLSASGTYKTSASVATLAGTTSSSDLKYSYCVSGNSLAWTPQSTDPAVTGAVVFQKDGATGSGGATG
jgi:hypothetical protein